VSQDPEEIIDSLDPNTNELSTIHPVVLVPGNGSTAPTGRPVSQSIPDQSVDPSSPGPVLSSSYIEQLSDPLVVVVVVVGPAVVVLVVVVVELELVVVLVLVEVLVVVVFGVGS
jgi:hypothetical protein